MAASSDIVIISVDASGLLAERESRYPMKEGQRERERDIRLCQNKNFGWGDGRPSLSLPLSLFLSFWDSILMECFLARYKQSGYHPREERRESERVGDTSSLYLF